MKTYEARAQLQDIAANVPDELLNFAKAMNSADHGPAIDEWPYFLSKPWKWADEYAIWCDCGRPQAGEPSFDRFLEDLEAHS